MRKSNLILTVLGTCALIFTYCAVEAESFPEKSGYLINTRGVVVRNSYAECWHTGYWTPAMAIVECDPRLVKAEEIVKEQPTAAGPSVPAPAPALAAPREAPMPPPAVVAQPKPVIAVHFNTEALFDFDRAVVRPDGQKLLDEKIVANMRMHPEVELLIITGHADRIGADEYNQDLSERRARAVVAFLLKRGIAAERMRASGKGESEPNPKANTRQVCKGKRGDILIACLQPDRRVTVESQSKAPAN
jgi:OmpA-OmpF porin, OOP family